MVWFGFQIYNKFDLCICKSLTLKTFIMKKDSLLKLFFMCVVICLANFPEIGGTTVPPKGSGPTIAFHTSHFEINC